EDTQHASRNLPSYKYLAKKFLYRCANSWLPFSEDAECFLQSLGITSSLHRSCWSIDTERFSPADRSSSGEEKETIAFVGALTELKGIMPLLEEWRSIDVEARKNFQLKVA